VLFVEVLHKVGSTIEPSIKPNLFLPRRVIFISKNKFGFVDGSIIEPALGHANHAAWHCNDNILLGFLILFHLSTYTDAYIKGQTN